MRELDLKILKKYLKFKKVGDRVDTLPKPVFEVADQMKAEGKLTASGLHIKNPDLTRENYREKLGFTADENIAELVVSLNRLGYKTIGSCEGHADRGSRYPYVQFWGRDIFRIASLMNNWEETAGNFNLCFIAGSTVLPQNYGRFFEMTFIDNSLEESRKSVKRLTAFLNRYSSPAI